MAVKGDITFSFGNFNRTQKTQIYNGNNFWIQWKLFCLRHSCVSASPQRAVLNTTHVPPYEMERVIYRGNTHHRSHSSLPPGCLLLWITVV